MLFQKILVHKCNYSQGQNRPRCRLLRFGTVERHILMKYKLNRSSQVHTRRCNRVIDCLLNILHRSDKGWNYMLIAIIKRKYCENYINPCGLVYINALLIATKAPCAEGQRLE